MSDDDRRSLPCVLFLQGGPGFECARPDAAGGWLGELAKEHRVILMDQRGTGRSSAGLVKKSTVEQEVSLDVGGGTRAEKWAKLLKCFRADSIVRDAELFRKSFLGEDVKWTLLGQSFGGFCITTYLSLAPEGVKEAMLTGGLPPLIDSEASGYETYFKLLRRVITQNERYFERFPGDLRRYKYVKQRIEAAKIANRPVKLPGGGNLTLTVLAALGFSNLGTAQGMERLHYIFENVDPELDQPLSHKFLMDVENSFRHFETNPLYAILHEAIYCNGANAYGAADELLRQPVLWQRQRSDPKQQWTEEDDCVLFTGEMVFSTFFDEIPSLKPYAEVLEALKREKEWPRLYDSSVLNKNIVPVACASYVEDMFVDFELAAETAAKIRGARVWSTSEYLHSGIREDGARVVQKLLSYVRDEDPIR